MHLADYFPEGVELNAVESRRFSTDINTTDGGYEVRNSRWATQLRAWDVSIPVSKRDGSAYMAVLALFEAAEGSAHSFNYRPWTDETSATAVAVRFDSALEITGITPDLDHIASVRLVEERQ